MRDTEFTSPDIIESRYRLGANQAALNIELALLAQSQAISSSGSSAAGTIGADTVLAEQIVGGGGGGGGGGSCFIGSTLFTLFGGETVDFQTLYAERDVYIGTFAKSYDEQDNVVKGKILDVTRTIAYRYLQVSFSDNIKSGVKPMHRYYIGNGVYQSIGSLKGEFVYSKDEKVQVRDYKIVHVPEGIKMFNAAIERYMNYEADRKRVHNAKPRGDDF